MAEWITPEELNRRIHDEEKIILIDVRNPESYKNHIPGAINIPIEELEDRLGEIPRSRTVVVY